MSRPKGSKNKSTVEAVAESVNEIPVMDKGTNVPKEESVIEKYADKPKKSDQCSCGHNKNLHYDGPKGWCNTNGCVCEAFSN